MYAFPHGSSGPTGHKMNQGGQMISPASRATLAEPVVVPQDGASWPIPLRRVLLSQVRDDLATPNLSCGASIYGLLTGAFTASSEGHEHHFRSQRSFY